jgi:titin
MLGNGGDGVTLDGNASGNMIGGPGAGNVISGNAGAGISISGAATNTTVQGNKLGTDVGGTIALGNIIGVFLNDAVGNLIGGTDPGDGNLISGNSSIGIQILRSSPKVSGTPDGNVVQGNFIGTDVMGLAPLGNGQGNTSGVGLFLNNARGNTIGGTALGAGNVISGNSLAGVSIFGQSGVNLGDTQGVANLLIGNIIGPGVTRALLKTTDRVTSQAQVLNQQQLGVVINTSTGNTLSNNDIENNIVGVEITGSVPATPSNPTSGQFAVDTVIGNTIEDNFNGVYLNQSTENEILNNTITSNVSTGITLLGNLTKANLIQGNTITGNTDGTSNPQSGTGIYIESAQNNLVQGNVISNNGVAGVYLFNKASGNIVQLNTIKKNHQYGVFLYNSAGNVNQIIRTGKNANKVSGNRIADFREFTGPVLPRMGTPKTTKGLKAQRVHGQHHPRG